MFGFENVDEVLQGVLLRDMVVEKGVLNIPLTIEVSLAILSFKLLLSASRNEHSVTLLFLSCVLM